MAANAAKLPHHFPISHVSKEKTIMYENHRDNFGRRRFEDERGNREQRWREGEDRYRREAASQSRYDEGRYDDRPGGRDEDLAGNAGYGAEQGTYG